MACETPITVSENTNLNKTLGYIRNYAIAASTTSQIKDIAKECSLSSDVLQAVFDTVYDLIAYDPDPENIQLVKAAHCSIEQGMGNCVDYSIVIGGILICLDIPFYFKCVSYATKNDYSHIYPITKKGIVLDCVLGQKQDGTDICDRPAKGQFNIEQPYKFKKLYTMTKLQILQGTIKAENNDQNMILSRQKLLRGGYNVKKKS
ncbi:MAG: hypothetical protein ACKVOU_03640 [Cytophagales bacterium]